MARIGIITCTNCTQDLDCASVVCLGDLRKRKGFFQEYALDEKLDLVGLINCAGCPTVGAPEKILRRIDSIARFKVDAIHFSYCMTAVCPFIEKYRKVIQIAYPKLKLVMGTHTPIDPKLFQGQVKDLLCAARLNMTDLVLGK